MSGTPPIDLKVVSSLGEAMIGINSSYTQNSLPKTTEKIDTLGSSEDSRLDEIITLVDHANYRVAFFSAAFGLIQGVPDAFKRLMQG